MRAIAFLYEGRLLPLCLMRKRRVTELFQDREGMNATTRIVIDPHDPEGGRDRRSSRSALRFLLFLGDGHGQTDFG